MSEPQNDVVLRAVTHDGSFRVIAARTTLTVREVVERQGAHGRTARLFADLVTGTTILREAMSPQQRVQGLLQGASLEGKGRLVADAQPDGTARGLVQVPRGADDLPLWAYPRLQVMRTLYNGQLQQGVVAVDAGGSISDALMEYLQTSEQVESFVAVGSIFEPPGSRVSAAGGYLVQLLPGAEEGPLAVMTARLDDFPPIEELLASGHADPSELLAEILYGMPYDRTAESALAFGCTCSQVRVAASLATLPRSEIERFVADGQLLEINCDYCGRAYNVATSELQGLLDEN